MNKYGFRFIEEKQIEEVKGLCSLWEHEQSGARLFHVATKDDNKVFSVSFRTPPEDDTGLPHILEHSVLCGSRKYPLKEPFVELVKGSLNTFLNAMTFPDKTMYPVASRNKQDFRNLMDVYLDAVFFPNIYTNHWILKQEGWHYELENVEGELIYNGVVFNEMKGVFSSADAVLEQKVFSALFPDTPYGKESGGDPAAIPMLTQEKFEEFHRTYYHPSNSFFYLYGDMDLDETLRFIHEEYLVHFDRIVVNSIIPFQAPFQKPVEETVEYSISTDDSTDEKAIFTLNWGLDLEQDLTLTMAMELLCYVLLATPASPLKKALQEAGIAKEISGDFQGSLLQPVFSVIGTYGDEKNKEEFEKIIFETLHQIVQDGLDPELVSSALHRKEFSLREGVTGSTPKGLIYGIHLMNHWLYEKSPFTSLTYEKSLAILKEKARQSYLEELIEKYLLQNNHRALVSATPKSGLTEEVENKSAETLAQWKAQQSQEMLENIILETKELKERQATPDSPEDLATIPLLKREDLEKEPDFPHYEKRKDELDNVFLTQEVEANGILYATLAFDAKVISQEDLGALWLLSDVLGRMDTENYSYGDLSTAVNSKSGGLSFALYSWGESQAYGAFSPRFLVRTKVLHEDISPLVKLIEEILLRTLFDDPRRLHELVREIRARMENSLNDEGQSIAVDRLSANFSDQGRYNFYGQLPYYLFIKQLDDDFDTRKNQLSQELRRVSRKLFVGSGLVSNVAGEKTEIDSWNSAQEELLANLPTEIQTEGSYDFTPLAKTEAIYTGSKVQYVVQGFDFSKLGQPYSGVYKLIEIILRYDYLWTRIRVQGGAYGANARFERSGTTFFSSYRDPNLKETLAVYQGISEYLRNFDPGEREMTKYIIGTMSGLDTPKTAAQKADQVLAIYFNEITHEDVRQSRQEILTASAEDIQKAAEWIEKGLKQNIYCVFGGEDKIKGQKELFEKIVSATNAE